MKILVINGPNLKFLGIREPDIYGTKTYAELFDMITNYCEEHDIEVVIYQSNHEGDIIDRILSCWNDGTDGIIINGGAYSHTSIAIADALRSIALPTINVHLTDPAERGRTTDYLAGSSVSLCSCKGKGFDSYIDALKIFSGETEFHGVKGLDLIKKIYKPYLKARGLLK